MVTCVWRARWHGMACDAALQATCRVAQRLKWPAGIALHRTANQPLFHASSGELCCTSPSDAATDSAAIFSLGGASRPLERWEERERKRKGHEGGIARETEEPTLSTKYMYYNIQYWHMTTYPVPEAPWRLSSPAQAHPRCHHACQADKQARKPARLPCLAL